MKKYIFTLVVVFGLFFMSSFSDSIYKTENIEMNIQSEYEQGWEDGYCEGWKDVKGQLTLCPLTPLCPLPTLDCSEGYKCGYNRGFKAGMKAAKND
jgi:hypothetical protein